MTSIRNTIIEAVAKQPFISLDDLQELLQKPRKNLQDNLKSCVESDLINRVVGETPKDVCYNLTSKGKAWLTNRSVVHHDSQQEVEQNTCSQRVTSPPVVPPVAALAAEQPAPEPSVTADTGADSEIGYCVLAVDKDGLHKTPDDAMRAAVGRPNLEDMAVCEIRPIGRIAMQPVMVPMP